uniref:Uncharacterized protein n=1 Tax=Vitis vinifera TaxID=29760 RepID=A5AMV5_VITVI|nr:hypothetical protein VITISV_002086 [Vitis vinifera]
MTMTLNYQSVIVKNADGKKPDKKSINIAERNGKDENAYEGMHGDAGEPSDDEE